jgi:hypothetical protein
MKRKPTAADRDIAIAIERLELGRYTLSVEDTTKSILFLGLARLKVEGSLNIQYSGKDVTIIPQNGP